MAEKTYQIIINQGAHGQRLDRALHDLLPELTRTRLQALITGGAVIREGVPVTGAAKKVTNGQIFDIIVPPSIDAAPAAQTLSIVVIYEDEDLLVIDKAAGMTVHPAPGNPDRTLVNALIAHCGVTLSGIGGVRRPGIVHRLDKNTSGLMVVAKNDRAHVHLAQQLSDRSLYRRYLGLVWGRPSPVSGVIDKPIGRNPADRKKMAVVAKGKPAITDYAVRSLIGLSTSLVECKLRTGRTHQIRVHMAAIGHPLVGDPLYGKRPRARQAKDINPAVLTFPRQALHAAEIGFIHPATGNKLSFVSDLPEDMSDLIAAAKTGTPKESKA